MSSHPVYRLHTLGDLALIGPSGPMLRGRRKELVILAFLARRSPREVSRDELAALFWGDRDETRARQSLRHALHKLRQTLADTVEVTTESAAIAEGRIELDAARLEQEIAAGRLDAAVERWHGEFLPGTEDSGAEGFRAWLESERGALRRSVLAAFERLALDAQERHDVDADLRHARRAAELFPLDTPANARLIQALMRDGEPGEARAVYDRHVARLVNELEVEVSPELARLGEQLERMRTRTRERSPGSAALLTPDLVGREPVFDSLVSLWGSVRERGGVALIEGEEGIGKTRLCDEFVRHVRARGAPAMVLEARAPSEEPAFAVARRLLAPLARAAALQEAPNKSLGEVAALLPELGQRFPHLSAASPDGGRVDAAVRDVLEVIAARVPVLMVVDDWPRADVRSRDMIASLARELPRGVCLLLTARSDELAAVATEVGRWPAAQRHKLSPLPLRGVRALLESMLDIPPEEGALLAERVSVESGGNPFFVLELVSSMADAGLLALTPSGRWRLEPDFSARRLPLPPSLRSAIRLRLSQLTEGAQRVAAACATLPPPVSPDAAREAAALAADAFDDAVDELLARRILRLAGAPRTTYEFTHELTRRVAADRARDRAALESPALPRRRWVDRPLWRAGLAAASAAVIVAAFAIGTRARTGDARPSAGGSERLVVVAAFANESGDPQFDPLGRVTADWLTRGVAQAGLISVAPPILPPPDSQAQRERPRVEWESAARQAGARYLISGAVYQQQDSLRFDAQITDVEQRRILRAIAPVTVLPRDAMGGIETVRQRVLTALAPALDVRTAGSAAVQSSPPTYDAYRAFAEGLDLSYAFRGELAVRKYLEAYALDSGFTLPLLYAALDYYGMGANEVSDSLLRILAPRQSELAPFDRHLLRYQIARLSGDRMGEYTAARDAAAIAPGSIAAVTLAPAAAVGINRPGEAVRLLSAVDVDHSAAAGLRGYWNNLAHALHMAGRYEEQIAVAREVQRRLPDDSRHLYYEARALAALGRLPELDVVLNASLSLPSVPGFGPPGLGLFLVSAEELRAHDHPEAALNLLDRALRFHEDLPREIQSMPRVQSDFAGLLYERGHLDEAQRVFDHLVATGAFRGLDGISTRARAGFVAARRGDSTRAEEVERWLRTSAYRYAFGWNTSLRARLAALRGRREEAMRLQQQAIAEGQGFSYGMHTWFEFQPLRGYPPFEEWLRPKG